MRFEKFLLPPTAIYRTPTVLTQRQDAFGAIAGSLDAYLLRTEESKSTVETLSAISASLAKTFEYLWLHGFYNLKDAPESIWENLRQALARGGWVEALEIRARTAALIADHAGDLSTLLGESRRPTATRATLRRTVLERLGTNIRSRELATPVAMISEAIRIPSLMQDSTGIKYAYVPKKMGADLLIQTLQSINLLSDIPPALGLPYVPNRQPHKFGQQNGKPGKNHESLEPAVLARLLKHAYLWLMDYGDAIATLVETLSLALHPIYTAFPPREDSSFEGVARRRTLLTYYWKKVVTQLPEHGNLESLIGKQITNLTRTRSKADATSLRAILNSLFAACFVVLAVMNARRHDEISDDRIGLHLSSCEVVDEELGIFLCEFYLEKEVRDYVPFFINDASFRAIDVLRRIAAVAWEWEREINPIALKREGRALKLFTMPNFLATGHRSVLRFEFNTNKDGDAREFVGEALGEQYVRIVGHMLRRAYGSVYHYCYEDADLLALMQKYGHLDPRTTRGYVGDLASTPLKKTAVARWAAPAKVIQRGNQMHVQDTNEIISDVGRVKLHTFVDDLLRRGRRFSGGFARLVARMHSALDQHVSYRNLDEDLKAKRLGELLIRRGYSPEPMPLVTCMAGSNSKLAQCVRSNPDQPLRAAATPMRCGGCGYSTVVEAHVHSMEEELDHMTSTFAVAPESVERHRMGVDIVELRQAIARHKERLGLHETKNA